MTTFPTELHDYVSAPEPAFAWQKLGQSGRVTTLRMTSQTWQDMPWTHDIVLVEPAVRTAKGIAILYLTGGDPNPLDLDEAHRLADLAGAPVAHLFHIPNQPLFDLSEDDLIAFTLERYLDTADAPWPLVLPMAKAAVQAMNVLEKATGQTANPLARFVLTGASKRGWAAWLSAATGDARILGVAPMVYDNLNIPAQLEHQVESWHAFSEMISPYVERGLPERLGTLEGQRLSSIVDPYTYRESLVLPKLIVTGTNDPYWSVDSMSLYWDGLKGPKWASVVPNAGHGLGDMSQALHAIAAFSRACAGRLKMPAFQWNWERDSVQVTASAPFPEMRMWVAESDSLDFRESAWWPRMESGAGRLKSDQVCARFHIPRSSRNQAVMVELGYRIKDADFSLTTPVRVFPS